MKVDTIGWNEFYNKLHLSEKKSVDDIITIAEMLYPVLVTLQTDFNNSFIQFPINNNLILQIIYTDDKIVIQLRENAVK